ncbi:MAG: hypothetical protein A3E31_10445 [Candidatus Rokubacteria bacterium RIFCSPHIGHO2_12_FULL_73_22]|nr:MAG: hypothetical protein A3E31_10445 [Candidatus Rokubacteria bacterium RIFCSPHIGHO2_12_FULL_73_22]OGL12057.1 MAG: hypothetical protein A3I14_15335 [Candidatus Rokubacteria bacterium RIFCSPLOWO2_02_FULL_73_56]OGL25822.1 MAG: hypothetical protein A3G44_04660 [Candidatus Rokubacteria bacterium RIFCSPLOWO2_12_FULL_73_47]
METSVLDVRWRPDGALACAWVRIPDGSWLGVEPAATRDAPWGLADRLWRARGAPGAGAAIPADAVALSVLEALDWPRIDRIPVLAEPGRLPPGGGAAVLNLLATLAARQGAAALPYRGPYPGERLFLTLLEAFRYVPAGVDDPLAAFVAGALAWAPAPFEPRFVADDLYVQWRGRIEKVVRRGVAYYRPDWQGVRRHAPRRVRDAPDGVRCGLWALGRSLEDHLLLAPDGSLVRALEPPAPRGVARAAAPRVWAGVAAVVAAQSAPPLAPFVRRAAEALTLEWGPVPGDLARTDGGRARVDGRVLTALGDALAEAPDRTARVAAALTALAEIAALVGDALRARAQAALAALPPERQAAALEAPAGTGGAREIVEGVEALLAEAGAAA